MKVRGIKRGKNIEIVEQVNNIQDVTQIIIDVEFIESQITEPQQALTETEKLAKLNQLFGACKNQPELTEIFTEIDLYKPQYGSVKDFSCIPVFCRDAPWGVSTMWF
jgi:antitoxin ParD1/3/4